ncbi:FAD-dependent oxidoreductase, partial [Acidobacteriota bacterium]
MWPTPDLPKKMLKGRDEEVMLCGHCLQGCLARVKEGKGIGCNVNPRVGHELDRVMPAAQPKHVVIVGGGPAGMQAALTAHQRGHRVTLFEKKRLGGQFALAFLPPGKERIGQPLLSLTAKVERSGIDLRLEQEATVEKLKALEPDAVIIATGSRPAIPDIPGLDDPITAEEVLTGIRETGDRVLILGGGMVGMEIAEFLAKRDKQCVVIEILDDVVQDMNPVSRKLIMKRLASLPVEIHTSTKLEHMEDQQAVVTHLDEQRVLGQFDSVVVTVGNRPYDPLSEDLIREGMVVEIVGDSEKPAKVYDAVNSGHRAAMAI